jgi:hypothetical protein
MKVYHYTHPQNCKKILKDNDGMQPTSIIGNNEYVTFALLNPLPKEWTENKYFKNAWPTLKLHVGQILLKLEIDQTSDNVYVIERAHMMNFNSIVNQNVHKNIPHQYRHETYQKALDDYIGSKIQLDTYLKENPHFELPEVIVHKTIPRDKISVSDTQPFLEENLITGGLVIGNMPPKKRSLSQRKISANHYLQSIPELLNWFKGYQAKNFAEA